MATFPDGETLIFTGYTSVCDELRRRQMRAKRSTVGVLSEPPSPASTASMIIVESSDEDGEEGDRADSSPHLDGLTS